jgi:membrane protein DedA with SNARE-associated domain
MLIIHGNQDAFVPPAVAKEHHRLVPHSQLAILSGGHQIVTRTSTISAASAFLDRVTSNMAPDRQQAEAVRQTASRMPLESVAFPPVTGIAWVATVLLIALATLISEDLACIGAGMMAARGTIGIAAAVGASFMGILLGDILLFLAGKWLGRPALHLPPLKWLLKPADIDRASHWFAAKGPAIIITSRFLPGSRLPTYFAAGMLDTGFWRFTLYFCVAAILWTPLLVGLAAVVGGQMIATYSRVQQNGVLLVAGTVLLLWLIVKILLPTFSYRGRRLLLSAWRRKRHWEFWHPYLFYIPVLAYIAYLAVRYRSLTVFSASNPGIPQGGFIQESKSQILDNLTADRHLVARYRVIAHHLPSSEKIAVAQDFMKTEGLTYPLVMKPDAGQRGVGVTIVKNEADLKTRFTHTHQDVIIQEYVDGYEFGVFYVRYPGQKSGQIFSITDKRLLAVVGDGQSTLERLILSHDRAVCMAPFHLKMHYRHLYDIPPKDQTIPLVEIGTHCRGALFLDGNHLNTPALEAVIDRLSRGFRGFYFGRYDIRALSVEDFKNGCNFKVIELNGVTSEATHIYHPGTRLWHAYQVLMQQWKMAFQIGAANRQRGIRPESFTNLAMLLLNPKKSTPH